MTDEQSTNEESKSMFPGGWHIERKPTIEMRIKNLLKKLTGRS